MSENPFNGQQLQGIRYERADMSAAIFDSVNLANAQFYAVLTNAKFTDTNLSEAVFYDVSLKKARFNNVNLAEATITNANLSNLSITDVTLAHTDIQNADLTGMRINGILVTDLFQAYQLQQKNNS